MPVSDTVYLMQCIRCHTILGKKQHRQDCACGSSGIGPPAKGTEGAQVWGDVLILKAQNGSLLSATREVCKTGRDSSVSFTVCSGIPDGIEVVEFPIPY